MNAAAIRPIPLLRRWVWVLWALLLAAVLAVAAVWVLNLRGEAPVSDVLPQAPASAPKPRQTLPHWSRRSPKQPALAITSCA